MFVTSLVNYSPTVCEVSVKLKFHLVTDRTKNCSNWKLKDYRCGCLKTQIIFLTIQHRAEPLALFLLQENPINVGYLKQPADWLQVSLAIAGVWRRWPQPRPQGAFPWLWEKRPEDKVALPWSQRFFLIFLRERDQEQAAKRRQRVAKATRRERKNLWLPWPRISLSCRRQGQDLALGRWLVDIFSNTQTNLIGPFNCNYRGDAEDFHTSFCLSLPGKKIVCMLHSQ